MSLQKRFWPDRSSIPYSTRFHTLFKAREGPSISSITGNGIRILLDNLELKNNQKAIIIEIRNKQKPFPESIMKVLKFVQNELGSSPDYVSRYEICIIPADNRPEVFLPSSGWLWLFSNFHRSLQKEIRLFTYALWKKKAPNLF
jgi:hypothetical protein